MLHSEFLRNYEHNSFSIKKSALFFKKILGHFVYTCLLNVNDHTIIFRFLHRSEDNILSVRT